MLSSFWAKKTKKDSILNVDTVATSCKNSEKVPGFDSDVNLSKILVSED